APLRDLPGSLSFQRGLLQLTVRHEEWLRQLTQYKGTPEALAWLEELRLGFSVLVSLLAGSADVLGTCTSLDLSPRFSEAFAWPVCHDLRHIRRLSLSRQILGGGSFTALTRSSLDSLRELRLGSTQLSEDVLAVLVRPDWLTGLTALHLEHNPIG